MTKPTPGPWFADEFGYIWRRDPVELYQNGGNVAGDRPIASVHTGWNKDYFQSYPLEANARLIAAAPDLLEALQEYVRLFEDHCITNPSSEDKDFTGYLAELARSAIKKATGEE
ncbi:MAG: hypothetical protein RL661_1401 [Pseudomonadota bacterium]|jgi:hypothetical protein